MRTRLKRLALAWPTRRTEEEHSKTKANTFDQWSDSSVQRGLSKLPIHVRRLACLGTVLIAAVTMHGAQLKLSGVAFYEGNSDGATGARNYWNTRGPDYIWNCYLFTGPLDSPVFLNTGDSDSSLNPNLTLEPGTYQLGFAGELYVNSYVGLNLYFNDDLTHNRITGVVAANGSTGFTSVATNVNTTDIDGGYLQPGAGTLSFTSGGLTVTLTEFFIQPEPVNDLVTAFSNTPGGYLDTVGRFKLTVVPADSALHIEVEGSQVRLRWFAQTNQTYQVQYRSALTMGLWTDLGSPVPGDDSQKSIADSVGSGQPQRFYRLSISR
jgi:hypothetical protein